MSATAIQPPDGMNIVSANGPLQIVDGVAVYEGTPGSKAGSRGRVRTTHGGKALAERDAFTHEHGLLDLSGSNPLVRQLEAG